MDSFLRLLIFLFAGTLLLIANVAFVRSVSSVFRRQTVIAPFKVIGYPEKDENVGITFSQMLQSRIRQINSEMEWSQNALLSADSVVDASTQPGIIWGRPPILAPLKSEMRVLDPVKVDVVVGGVQIAPVFSWLQQMTSDERTLKFSVCYEKGKAIVTGDPDAYLQSRGNSIWIEVPNASMDEITTRIAYELLYRRAAQDPQNKVELLNVDEFRTLVDTITETAHLNHKITLGRAIGDGYTSLFERMEKLSEQAPKWYQLVYFTANLAEQSGEPDKALGYYTQLRALAEEKSADATKIEQKIKGQVLAKIDILSVKKPLIARGIPDGLRTSTEYAMNEYNKLFGMSLRMPAIKLNQSEMKNAYWMDSENAYYTTPEVSLLPDITYHEISHAFLPHKVDLQYQGQSGAILESYADILATWLKQKKNGFAPTDSDWLFAPGGVAWIKGEEIGNPQGKPPIHSLIMPGTAYDDPVIGKDPQVAHIKDLWTEKSDNGGIHINMGIPNKAFYEVAVRIGIENALRIWLDALPLLSKSAGFVDLADLTYSLAAQKIAEKPLEAEAVKSAWTKVGIIVPDTAEQVPQVSKTVKEKKPRSKPSAR